MTRTVHPYPLAKNDGASSSSSAIATGKSSHPYEVIAQQQQQRTSAALPVHTGAPSVPVGPVPPAVPISVTTASHPDPGVTPSTLLLNVQLASGGMPQKQLHLTRGKPSPPALAGPKGGFTLPRNAIAAVPASPVVPKPAPVVSMKKSASAAPLMQGYSAASIASIQAQDVKTPNALGRWTVSAPNTTILAKNKTKAKYKYRKVVGGKPPTSSKNQSDLSPQTFLDKMLATRGYSTNNFCSLDGGYYCKPTSLQQASYGLKVIQAVRTSDGELLRAILDCGLSPNPCNKFGESVVHMVCRRGDFKLLKILADAGCSFQVTDDFGRTPLHDACWVAEPSFDCVELILNHDVRLLHIVDCRGSSPLSYVKREHWKQWIEFFRTKADTYWPPRDVSKEGEQTPPTLARTAAQSSPLSDPKNAIPIELATLISSGKLDPNEFLRRKKEAMKGKQLPTKQTSAPVAASS